jgi:hypothetical protein
MDGDGPWRSFAISSPINCFDSIRPWKRKRNGAKQSRSNSPRTPNAELNSKPL